MFPLASNGGSQRTYIEDLFSTYLYTGNGSTQTITNGIDLVGKGGLVWIKQRNQATSHRLFDTARGVQKSLVSDTTAAESASSTYLTAFNNNGFTVGTGTNVNENGYPLVAHTFRKAAKFFDVVTYTGNGANGRQISHNLGCEPGLIIIKNYGSGTANWTVWHRSLSSGYYLLLNSTAAQANTNSHFGAVTSSYFTVNNPGGTDSPNGNTDTLVAYVFAHDTSADGLIQCGSFTTDGSGNATVTLGWEPQFAIAKCASVADSWWMWDTMREWTVDSAKRLLCESAGAESASITAYKVNNQGFSVTGVGASRTYIYLAIRRGPMKPPTSGTQVYNAIARTGTGAAATVTGVGFPIDFSIIQSRAGASPRWGDRLRGPASVLRSNLANAELTAESDLSSFDMDGISLTGVGASLSNATATAYINYFFRRYPGVFDQTCWEGNSTDPRTIELPLLGVPAEMIVAKARSANDWVVWHSAFGNSSAVNNLYLNSTSAIKVNGGLVGTTVPTANGFKVADGALVNATGNNYAGWAFATLAGISKVGSYTGNGTSQTIDCGFAAGARFVMVKRVGSIGSWNIFDTVRGIVAGNDPRLYINTTGAEVTGLDTLDPHASGFIVNQDGENLNVNSETYIYVTIA